MYNGIFLKNFSNFKGIVTNTHILYRKTGNNIPMKNVILHTKKGCSRYDYSVHEKICFNYTFINIRDYVFNLLI